MLQFTRSSHPRSTALTVLTGACLIAISACGDRTNAATDSAAAATAAAASDSVARGGGMAGMQHGNTNAPAPRDSNQSFLRMMVDHHEGLVAMTDTAMPRLTAAERDARTVRTKQDEEQQEMKSMLVSAYGDNHTPMIMPSNSGMLDSVRGSGAGDNGADAVWYLQIDAHHREGVQMIDQMLSHLTGDVRQMAERMRADQQREITEFERKSSQPGG